MKSYFATYWASVVNSDENSVVRAIRRLACADGMTVPILVISGGQSPRLKGAFGHYTTLSGKTEIRYPKAYRWPKAYHRSTLRIELGHTWLAKKLKSAIGKMEKVEARRRVIARGQAWALGE